MNCSLADEGFAAAIVRGLLERGCEIVTVQQLGMESAADSTLLALAAENGWVMITHDADTLIAEAWTRVRVGAAMPGVILVPWGTRVGRAVDQVFLLLSETKPEEMANSVRYVRAR